MSVDLSLGHWCLYLYAHYSLGSQFTLYYGTIVQTNNEIFGIAYLKNVLAHCNLK